MGYLILYKVSHHDFNTFYKLENMKPKRIEREKALLLVCDVQDNFAEETYCYKGVMVIV